MSKQRSELLVSRLKGWNLLAKGTKISSFRKRNATTFCAFYNMENSLGTYSDIDSLMQELNIYHSPCEWRLFIDLLKYSVLCYRPIGTGIVLWKWCGRSFYFFNLYVRVFFIQLLSSTRGRR